MDSGTAGKSLRYRNKITAARAAAVTETSFRIVSLMLSSPRQDGQPQSDARYFRFGPYTSNQHQGNAPSCPDLHPFKLGENVDLSRPSALRRFDVTALIHLHHPDGPCGVTADVSNIHASACEAWGFTSCVQRCLPHPESSHPR